MDVFLAIVAVLCGLTGIIGSFAPVLPGPPISWLGLLLLYFTKYSDISITWLIIWLAITVAVSVADYLLPVWMTKKYGGSRPATIGTTLGLIAGFFVFPPWGMIFLPFAGAFIGELVGNKSEGHIALRVAFGAFMAFLLGTGLKLISSGIMFFYILKEIIL